MLRIRPYKPADAIKVVGWIKDEMSFRKWCADRYDSYPITADDMNRFYDSCGDDIFAFTAFDETGVAGHFTLRFFDEDKDELRLGFVIVDDARRGKGYGREMVSLALKFAFELVKVQKVTLGVFENNDTAFDCYAAVGFRKTDGSWSCTVRDEEWLCRSMAITAEEYFG